jgi:hypothetical protein
VLPGRIPLRRCVTAECDGSGPRSGSGDFGPPAPTRPVRVSPFPGDQGCVPALNRLRRDQSMAAGGRRTEVPQRGEHRRSAQSKRGFGLVRRSTSSSASFDTDDRASNANQPVSRTRIRYSRRIDTARDHAEPAQHRRADFWTPQPISRLPTRTASFMACLPATPSCGSSPAQWSSHSSLGPLVLTPAMATVAGRPPAELVHERDPRALGMGATAFAYTPPAAACLCRLPPAPEPDAAAAAAGSSASPPGGGTGLQPDATVPR